MDSCCSSFTECDPCTKRTLLRFSEMHPARPPLPLPSRTIWILPVLHAPSCFLSLLPPFAHSSSLLSQQVEQLKSFDTDVMTYCSLEHKADSRSSFRFFPFPSANFSINKTHLCSCHRPWGRFRRLLIPLLH